VHPRYGFKQRIALALVPPVAAMLVRLLGSTLRVIDIGPAGSHVDENPAVRVYCLWHRTLLTIAYHFRKRRIAVLFSHSFDGEMIAQTLRRIGYTPARGSSSRGGAVGLRGMQRVLNVANLAAFAIDGPRGPIYKAKPGAAKLAQMVGGGVGVFYALPERAWQLRSWDRFLVPRPFSRVVVAWERPVPVPANANAEELEMARVAVEEALERARHAAEAQVAAWQAAKRRGPGRGR
jgi:lysophospholipid acyltransferase (LPLAT)-like uncharacterized protein